MSCPLISVIVPIFNVSDYLEHCVHSIINQTYANLQIILVDDGSTDDSGGICDSYAFQDCRISVIHRDNGGSVRARKSGLELATGDYIGFVDADDYIEPQYYEVLLNEIIESNVDFVHSGYVEEKNNGSTVKALFPKQIFNEPFDKMSIIKDNVIPVMTNDVCITPSLWSKLYKANFIKKCFNDISDDLSIGEDVVTLCRSIMECSSFSLLPVAYYHYFIRDDSVSHNAKIKNIMYYGRMYEALRNLFIYYEFDDSIFQNLDNYFRSLLIGFANKSKSAGVGVPRYVFSDVSKLHKKRIVIYGAGIVGKSYFSQLIMEPDCSIVAWVDKRFSNKEEGICQSPDVLRKLNFDYLIIAIEDNTLANTIKDYILDMEIESNKIIWQPPMPNIQ